MESFLFLMLTFATTTFLAVKLHGYATKKDFFASGKLSSMSTLFNVSLVLIWLVSIAAMTFPTAYGSGVVFFFFCKIFTGCKSATHILAIVVPGFLWGVLSLPMVFIARYILLRVDKRLSCDRHSAPVDLKKL
jgi:hypothetical protein